MDRLGEIGGIVRDVCGNDTAKNLKKIWGLNSEGEINGAWRDIGIPNTWYMLGGLTSVVVLSRLVTEKLIGNLALCRFHSKHVALREL